MNRTPKRLAIIALPIFLAVGCAQLPQPGHTAVTSNPAVQSLYQQALADKHAGRPEQAQAGLERAVRIEPANPNLWFQLAHIASDSGATAKARGLAQRAHSLSGSDPYLSRQIEGFLQSLE